MAVVKVLKDNELIGGIDNTSVYPVTHTKAVFNSSNKNLETILKEHLDKINKVGDDLKTLTGDPDKMEGVIDTFTEIERFLTDIAAGTTLNDIILPLSLGLIAIDINPITGIVTAISPNEDIRLDLTQSKINSETGKVQLIIDY